MRIPVRAQVAELAARVVACLAGRRADTEMSREMHAHLRLLADDFECQGMAREEAERAARRAFGGLDQAKELHRDARTLLWLEQLGQDVRHALRALRKSPGFTAAAIVTLVLGIGANSAVFTLVHGILLRDLPVADPERIVQVRAQLKTFDSAGFSYPGFREIERQREVFSEAIAFSSRPALLDRDGDTVRVDMQLVTGSFFRFFAASPHLGRLLGPEDDEVERARFVCVLSHRAWERHFSSDATIVGQVIRVDGVPLEVVGVTRPDFVGAEMPRRFDVWVPTALALDLTRNPRETPNYVWLQILARLRPDVSFDAATASLEAASPSMEDALPPNRANAGAVYRIREARAGADTWRSELRQPLTVLMGAVVLVLLIACANLANLLLARANQRRHEFAIRLSLGVQRLRLVRQVLLETLLVALAGALGGLLLAAGVTPILLDLFNQGNQWRPLHVDVDAGVLWFTAASALLTAVVAGVYPAWHASRTNPMGGLRPATVAGRGRATVRRSLIVVQVTLAVVLVFGANLFALSLGNLRRIDLGLDMQRVLTVQLEPAGERAAAPVTAPADLQQLLERVRHLPAVESAALAAPGVLSGGSMTLDIEVPDAAGGTRTSGNVRVLFASPGYLNTLRLPLLTGRDFRDTDRPGTPPVALVNEHLASQLWPGESPIGRRIKGWNASDMEIVGVVANSKYSRLREPQRPIVIQAIDQASISGVALQIRCRARCAEVPQEVRHLVKAVAPGFLVANLTTLETMRENLIAQPRLFNLLSSMFGVLGTILALVGIYALIAYSVASRAREVGIRIAIGAPRGSVLWLFARESAALAVIGVLLGMPLALVLARYAESMVYGVTPLDPTAFMLTLLTICSGVLIATLIPARRGTLVNPVEALRCE